VGDKEREVNVLLRITGIEKLISAYKYVQFNGLGVVRFSGIGLILLIGVIHVLLLPWHYETVPYLGVSFGVLFAGSLLSALGIFRGAGWGWALGSTLCVVASASGKAQDSAKVYDFSIRWGALMSGRLKRLEHYYRAGELTEVQERRYRELRQELEDATPLAEQLGISRPTVPLEV
jgi:hypothetical protein